MEIRVESFTGSAEGFSEAMVIRTRVFVEEQHVPVELERDEFDAAAVHVLIRCDGRAAGTGRLFRDPDHEATMRLGRVAVLREFRGLGLGKMLIEELVRLARENAACSQVLLHAQKTVIGLYSAVGFEPVGGEFVEAGIVHQEMVARLR